jgi:YidC/Oxa1 family membrane protein insertase
MDRNATLRLLAIGGAVFLFFMFVMPKLTGSGSTELQPLQGTEGTAAPKERAPEQICALKGDRYKAELSSQGAALKHMWLEGAKYTVDGRPTSAAMDLVTTPDVEARRPLRVELRYPTADTQVDYDNFDWKLEAQSGSECRFTYEDEKVALTKIIRAVPRPFEMEMELSVKNKLADKATHRAAIETDAWRLEEEIKGGLGRQSPFLTTVDCAHDDKLDEKTPGDFEPSDFKATEFKNGWLGIGGKVEFAATSNFYFSQALAPLDGPSSPICELQIEDRWDPRRGKKSDDPQAGAMYRSRLAYAPKDLGPGESATYKVLHFAGPKERDVLASAGGGAHRLSDLIKLGTFAAIAKVLVLFLTKCHQVVGSWGVSIILLTMTVRTLLFPLTWKTIKSGAQMRKIKPEIDALNEKFKDDAQQKQLATMELWRKHGVNPLAGCLPMLVQMPVWFALYTALQTAAELYHTPFLWFRDLSAPDTIHVASWDLPFILPVLLGATTFIQQKIMPQQMDPAQQKMMQYMMPAVFTAMMLFLPSGLGVYMFTNSLLGIAQQLAVEKYYASQGTGGGGGSGISVREKSDDDKGPGGGGKGEKARAAELALGKGNARV